MSFTMCKQFPCRDENPWQMFRLIYTIRLVFARGKANFIAVEINRGLHGCVSLTLDCGNPASVSAADPRYPWF